MDFGGKHGEFLRKKTGERLLDTEECIDELIKYEIQDLSNP